MRVAFAVPAEADLGAIIDFIALDRPKAAEAVYRAIVAATEALSSMPDMGRRGRFTDTREFPLASLPYIFVCKVADETLVILAIVPTSRDLARALRDRRRLLQK
jgi:toxin ParE1/3/4